MKFPEILRELRESRGLTQKQLSAALKISISSISMYENGNREPDLETLETIADYFNVDINRLTGNLSPFVTYPVGSSIMVPIVANICAGFNGAALEDFQGYEPAYDLKSPGECVWFKVKGDSMAPEIKDSDLVLVRKQSDIESGEIAVLIYDGEDGTVKRIIKHDGAISLMPINPKYEPRVIIGEDLKNVIIYGKVIEVKRKY